MFTKSTDADVRCDGMMARFNDEWMMFPAILFRICTTYIEDEGFGGLGDGKDVDEK